MSSLGLLLVGNIGLDDLHRARNADGTAVINTLQQLFGAIGTAVASTLVSMGQASLSSDIAAGTALGTQWALTLNVGLSIVMVVLVLMGLRYNEN